jgi:hypothetical protein
MNNNTNLINSIYRMLQTHNLPDTILCHVTPDGTLIPIITTNNIPAYQIVGYIDIEVSTQYNEE